MTRNRDLNDRLNVDSGGILVHQTAPWSCIVRRPRRRREPKRGKEQGKGRHEKDVFYCSIDEGRAKTKEIGIMFSLWLTRRDLSLKKDLAMEVGHRRSERFEYTESRELPVEFRIVPIGFWIAFPFSSFLLFSLVCFFFVFPCLFLLMMFRFVLISGRKPSRPETREWSPKKRNFLVNCVRFICDGGW